MDSYEARRLENIKRNAALIQDLGLEDHDTEPEAQLKSQRKRRKPEIRQPTRTSARLAANGPPRSKYDEDSGEAKVSSRRTARRATSPKVSTKNVARASHTNRPPSLDGPHPRLASFREGWTSWVPAASAPTRDDLGTYHFDSHPDFRPNKSPEEIIREGCFGGSYWRPLYSRHLRATVEDDWRELPSEWTNGLNIDEYLTSPAYNPEINKYGVACGQSIEEWEASGWINHYHDVRGWFQWYCRFWMGRRCDDDERQIQRWKNCVGETGRWRRTLLKKYVKMGIRSAFDEGDKDDGESGDVSPVIHQTCHHWAYEVRQEALDRFWTEGK